VFNFTADKTERLDKFLARQLSPERSDGGQAEKVSVSRGKVQKAIKDGLVLVNDKKEVETDRPLKLGDKIQLPEFESNELKPVDINLKVIFENKDLVVLDKPAGLMVHPAAGRDDDTLSHALLSQFPDIKDVGDAHRPGIVHRLDEDTSGLLVVAKTAEAFDYLKGLFAGRNIEKYYLTLVHGVPENMHGVIDAPIGKTTTHQKMRVGEGREAKTEYWVLAEGKLALDQVALLKVKLHTGRTHQIRVHMAHIGHPVFGDQLYGGQFKNSDSQILARQFLHAFRLKFQLMDGTYLEVESELPDELQKVLQQANINIPSPM
jgi:23S rRNA pseudouridine1911/1915/1917 synthase